LKKILVGYDDGIIENSIVFEAEPTTNIGTNTGWEVVSYGFDAGLEWHIRPEFKTFSIFDIRLGKWNNHLKKEEFLSNLTESYPADVEFFLFHPEALDGKLPDQYNKA
jgi:hypothetical protein